MAFTQIDKKNFGFGANGGTSPTFNSVNAKLICFLYGWYTGVTASVGFTDNQGNSGWVDKTLYAAGVLACRVKYIIDPTNKSAVHTLALSGSGTYSAGGIYTYNADGSIIYDGENGNSSAGSGTSLAANSITAALLLRGLVYTNTNVPTMSGYNVDSVPLSGGNYEAFAIGSKEQTSGANAPTWLWTGASAAACAGVGFHESAPPATINPGALRPANTVF